VWSSSCGSAVGNEALAESSNGGDHHSRIVAHTHPGSHNANPLGALRRMHPPDASAPFAPIARTGGSRPEAPTGAERRGVERLRLAGGASTAGHDRFAWRVPSGAVTTARNFSNWAYWRLHLEGIAPTDPCPVDELTAGYVPWRARARRRVDDLLGPVPVQVPLALETTDSVDCGSYRRDRVVFDTEPAMSVPAFLLVPHAREHGAPGPAVLAVHGHGPGKSSICGIEAGDEGDDYAHRFATAGYVVLAPDLRGFGERADPMPAGKYECDWNLVCATMAGVVPLQRNLWDLQRSLDVLCGHSLVDAGRVGVAGFSYGATCALFLAAIDDRVRAAIVSGYLSSWQSAHAVPWNMCGSQVLPAQLGRVEHLDVAALVAPRALLVESGADDPIFPAGAAQATVDTLRTVYAHLGEPDALVHDVFAGAHRWHGALAEPFLGRWL
jgi:dienelactone hydrolase